MIIGVLGGMRTPRIDEQVTSAVANGRGYPRLTISGMSMFPVAATPVKALPEIAPIRAHVTVATTPRPPRMRPTKTSTNSRRYFAMPLSLISDPA